MNENETSNINGVNGFFHELHRNRDSILSHILHIYNSRITEMPVGSYASFCHMTSRVCKSGMTTTRCDDDDVDDDDGDSSTSAEDRRHPVYPPGIASLAGFGGPTVTTSSVSSSSIPASPPVPYHHSPRLRQRFTHLFDLAFLPISSFR